MKRYIDKDALVAEIENRIKEIEEIGTYLSPKGMLTNLLCYINGFEVKEVDLYHELDEYFEQFKGFESTNWNWRVDSINIHSQGIYDFAKHFFELGLKTQKGEQIMWYIIFIVAVIYGYMIGDFIDGDYYEYIDKHLNDKESKL